jgi:hypothetical protein
LSHPADKSQKTSRIATGAQPWKRKRRLTGRRRERD